MGTNHQNWEEEALGVIVDIKQHVSCVELSKILKITAELAYINLTTIEKHDYCIELSASGYRVVGEKHDTTNLTNGEYFETPYSLLNKISPMYNKSFGNALAQKLSLLQNNTIDEK